MKNNNFNRLIRGLSLVELMVGMTIGLIASAALVVVYSSNQRTAKVVNIVSRSQQDLRYAAALLTDDISRAGSYGCASGDVAPQIMNSLVYHPYGLTYTTYPTAALTVAYMETPLPLEADIVIGNTNAIQVNTATTMRANEAAMLSNCFSRVIYNVPPGGVSNHSAFTSFYPAFDSLIGKYVTHTYSICSGNLCRDGNVIAEGVSDMSVRFAYATGEDDFSSLFVSTTPATNTWRPVLVEVKLDFVFREDFQTGAVLAVPVTNAYYITVAPISNIRRANPVSAYTEPDPTNDGMSTTACPP